MGERDLKIKNDFYDEIKSCCLLNSIMFFNRKESPLIPEEVLKVAVSWKWIINSKPFKLIVFHDSLLPRLRGFNPLVTSLINGDTFIGVSLFLRVMNMIREILFIKVDAEISYPITILEAINLIEENYKKVASKLVSILSKDKVPSAVPQDEKLATYSLWRGENDYFIDWESSSKLIRRFIDAVGYPYKGAASLLNGNLVRIIKSKEFKDVVIENRAPGKIIFLKKKNQS